MIFFIPTDDSDEINDADKAEDSQTSVTDEGEEETETNTDDNTVAGEEESGNSTTENSQVLVPEIEGYFCYIVLGEEPQCYKVTGLSSMARSELEARLDAQNAKDDEKVQTVYHYGGSVYQDHDSAEAARQGDNAAPGTIMFRYVLDGITYDNYGDAIRAAGMIDTKFSF